MVGIIIETLRRQLAYKGGGIKKKRKKLPAETLSLTDGERGSSARRGSGRWWANPLLLRNTRLRTTYPQEMIEL